LRNRSKDEYQLCPCSADYIIVIGYERRNSTDEKHNQQRRTDAPARFSVCLNARKTTLLNFRQSVWITEPRAPLTS
jgi:hypothetical protein